MNIHRTASRVAVVIALLVAHPAPILAQRIHAMLVGDTTGVETRQLVGTNVQVDLWKLENAFKANVPESQLRIRVLAGPTEIQSSSILEAIRSYKGVGEQDTFVFYFSGHGATDAAKSPPEHFFQVRNSTGRPTKLYRKDVREAALSLKARLTVILTDTCSTIVGGGQSGKLLRRPAPPSPPGSITPLFKRLLIDARGVADISGTKPGEAGGVDLTKGDDGKYRFRGSCFTFPLCDFISKNGPNSLAWKELVEGVTETVADAFQESYPGREQKTQTVYVFTHPSYDASVSGVRGVRVVSVRPGFPGSRCSGGQGNLLTLEPGDFILEINGRPMNGLSDYDKAVDASPAQMRFKVRDADGRLYDLKCMLREGTPRFGVTCQ